MNWEGSQVVRNPQRACVDDGSDRSATTEPTNARSHTDQLGTAARRLMASAAMARSDGRVTRPTARSATNLVASAPPAVVASTEPNDTLLM